MARRPLSTHDILDGHVSLRHRVSGSDLPQLVRAESAGRRQVVQFLAVRGFPIPSPAGVNRIGERFRDGAVRRFAEGNRIPVVRFAKADRKIDVMSRHLARQAATGRSGVTAIGVAQEFQRVATCTVRQARNGGAPHFRWDRAQRRVSCFYFYLWDRDFGSAFIKICAHFPYPIKMWLFSELSRSSMSRCGRSGFTGVRWRV